MCVDVVCTHLWGCPRCSKESAKSTEARVASAWCENLELNSSPLQKNSTCSYITQLSTAPTPCSYIYFVLHCT